ncbi:hypothetical protein, conserved [Eimeria acervulina]|uniref:Uncharacterized protein n=1 Tax=Eimeria acervulina TaxID=5801 RepID=U6GIY5_EIMAC|nr:hypothetical protein, conserved [Eimeria acervulina]CDI78549.1 hypothetical protein, conserved [Eimeria acervulina]
MQTTNKFFQNSASLCDFVAAAVPVIFPLFYTFPKLAALVNTFLAHKKLLQHDSSMKASPASSHDPAAATPAAAAATPAAATATNRPSPSKLRADAVLEQLEKDLSRVIELDL